MPQRKTRISGNLTIRQLEVFAVASRYPTFSEAAKFLEISQPTLSNMIAKVEEQLGLSLFDRTTRTLALTAEGERLAHVAQDLVRDFQATVRSIHETAGRRHGRLSMAVLPSVAATVAPAAIKLFLQTYPDFDIGLHDTARQEGMVWVLDRVVDFGILTGGPKLSELRSETIFVDHFQVVVPQGSELAKRTALGWADVAGEQVILAGTQQIRNDVDADAKRAGVSITPRFEVQNIMTGLSLVAAGLGVAVLPKLYLSQTWGAGIRAIPLLSDDFKREIQLVHRSDRILPEAVGHMMACFRTVFAQAN